MFEIEIIDNEDGDCKSISFAPEEINRICRLCLDKNGVVNLFSIEYKGTTFSDIFNKCFAPIHKADKFPKNICDSCTKLYKQFCEFREQILQSQNLLEMAFGEIKQDFFKKSKECENGPINGEIKNNESSLSDTDVAVVDDENNIPSESLQLTKQTYICSCCENKFYSYQEYKDHTYKKVNKISSKTICHICGRSVEDYKLKSHMLIHSEKNSYACDICGLKLTRKDNLKRHRYTHALTKPHMCHICGKGFIQAPSLADHLRIHNNLKPFISHVCGRRFASKMSLGSHLKLHNRNPELQCNKTGRTPREINRNMTCQYCHKKLDSYQRLKIHVRSHTGEKPYVCSVCEKGFYQKHHLTGHLRLHSGEKPYKCNYCGKCFALKGNLSQHIKIHTVDKPFSCNICKKDFCTNSSLKKHTRIHLQ